MSPLDVNQSDKGNTERIAIKAFSSPGNQFIGGQVDSVSTKSMSYDNWLFDSFFFPVDSCIWDIGCTWSHQVNRDNDHSDLVPSAARTKQPLNAEGDHMIGISLFSPRDLPYNGADGMTPLTPKQKTSRQADGSDIEWVADVIVGVGTEEIALRNRGYYNKAARQLLYFNQVSTGTNVSKQLDFTKSSKKRGKRSRKRAFEIEAGSKLVFWSRNMTGADDDDLEIKTAAQITPRIRWFPKQNVIQNFNYVDQSYQMWGANMNKELITEQGDGVNELFTTHTADEVKA